MAKYFPFKPARLKVMQKRPQHIVIHHTHCLYPINSKLKIDNEKEQIPFLDIESFGVEKEADINFHYVVEEMKGDFRVISCRPIVTFCDFDDLPNQYNYSIHVAVMGNLDLYVPKIRLYEVMTYRLINPVMRFMRIDESRVRLHSEISTNKDVTCPGMFLEKENIIRMIRRFLMK